MNEGQHGALGTLSCRQGGEEVPFKLKDLCICEGEWKVKRALNVRVVYFAERKDEKAPESRELLTCFQGTDS